MKAVVARRYGPPAGVRIEDLEIPTPRDGDLLVEVRAVSLNASDLEFLTGSPGYIRMWGPTKPKFPVVGSDIAGRVTAVGAKVTRFAPGDEVFGDVLGTFGGLAEYACVPAEAMTRKPAGLGFVEAACLPQAACVALQGLRDRGRLRAGEAVLVNGAGGGSGTFAIQIAKHLGAEVTGVDNTVKQECMLRAGADHVIDYTCEDFTRQGRRYDLILDFVSPHPLLAVRRALRPRGRYVLVGGSLRRILGAVTLGPLLSIASSQRLGLLAARPNGGLDEVLSLLAAGTLRPMIDATVPLAEAGQALQRLADGRACGKLVVEPHPPLPSHRSS